MMSENTGIQPVMPMGGGFGDGWMGIFGLLVLLGILNGGGGFFGGNGNSNAIQNDINRGFDNQNLQAQTRDMLLQYSQSHRRQHLQSGGADAEDPGRHLRQPHCRHAEPDQPAAAAAGHVRRGAVSAGHHLECRRVSSDGHGGFRLIETHHTERAPAFYVGN